jgi:hypothetical protein
MVDQGRINEFAAKHLQRFFPPPILGMQQVYRPLPALLAVGDGGRVRVRAYRKSLPVDDELRTDFRLKSHFDLLLSLK